MRKTYTRKRGESMIQFKCTKCGEGMESPMSMGGEAIECPKCGLHEKVPIPPTPKTPKSEQIIENQQPGIKIIPCPDCQKDVSIHATACPHCGNQLKQAVTIEATGKQWKFGQLCGVATCIIGAVALAASPAFGVFAIIIGLMVFIGARIAAWWYHG